MATALKRELTPVLERLDPDGQASAQRDLDLLERAGVQTVEALEAIAGNAHAGVPLRAAACWFVARLTSPAAYDALLACLGSDDPALRAEAARGLGTLGDPRAAAPLLSAMQADGSVDVRVAAVYGLGLLADERQIEPLIRKLEDVTEAPAVRGMAAETLGNLLDPRAVESLIAALADPAVEVRFWAVFALGELGAAQALPELHRLAATDTAVLPRWWSVQQEARAAIRLIERQPEDDDPAS